MLIEVNNSNVQTRRRVNRVGVKVEVNGNGHPEVLSKQALAFVAGLHESFNPERQRLLAARRARQQLIDAGELPDFLSETRLIRQAAWRVAPAPGDLGDRRVEITGPPERKMMINALNSGAQVFMADFEDATSPAWANIVEGQRNLRDAVRGTISAESADGRRYELKQDTATLFVRPRGWHLEEKHVLVNGLPISASLFDFGMAFFHNAWELLDAGSGPYFYLPKLESHMEARLWNEVFLMAQKEFGISPGTIKATVLVENVLAAFEMDEILYELRAHSAGLNAGRWDYIFSYIKKFRQHPQFVLPDRSEVSMTFPFMRAYTELLVRTCHRRGVHAIGGMAAFIPNRHDPEVTFHALGKVREDKVREAEDGFDGTWVAHPDLVPVAKKVFDRVLGGRPNQLDVGRLDVAMTAASDLLKVDSPGQAVSEQGLRTNVGVGIQYLESWLGGVGATSISNLMEDAATAEICRAQVWQWRRHGVRLQDGTRVTKDLIERTIDQEASRLQAEPGCGRPDQTRLTAARDLFARAVLTDPFIDFLTLPAYELVD